MDSFKYSPLSTQNETRVVVLEAGKGDDDIKCRLRHISLSPSGGTQSTADNCVWYIDYVPTGRRTVLRTSRLGQMTLVEEPTYSLNVQRESYSGNQYDALSYAWGDPNPTHLITLNWGSFLVAKNLYDALRRLRLCDRPRILWIDAISIDQRNIPERNQQVRKMRWIFSSASSVIVWLGEADNGSNDAFEMIKAMNFKLSWIGKQNSATYKSATSAKNILGYSETSLKGLSKLLTRSWWERIWIVQEVVVGVEVVITCGSNTIPWSFFRCVSQAIQRYEFRSHANAQILRSCDYRKFSAIDYFRESKSMTLFSLLRSTRTYKATDPRDKLYALLGLATDPEITALEPDYNKPVTVVYQDLVRFMLSTQGSLDIITSGRISLSENGNPSWLPTWKASDNLLPLIAEEMAEDPYKAAGESSAAVNMSQFPDVLQTKGVCADKVSYLGGSVQIAQERMAAIQRWEYIATEFFHFRKSQDDFWRTIVADKTDTGHRAEAEFGKAFRPFIDGHETSSIPTQPFSDAVTRAVMGRRFFITRKGYMGLGPADVSLGDLVCILPGCQVPLLLRAVDGGQVLVGEAYVHRMMSGEVMEGLR
jgi:hypothetical protein